MGKVAMAKTYSPRIARLKNIGIDANMTNRLYTPLNTSIVFTVLAVTGIAISIRKGYKKVKRVGPINGTIKAGSYELKKNNGKDANIKKNGLRFPLKGFQSSNNPIKPDINKTVKIERTLTLEVK